MAIEVELPDGSVAEFPEGTPKETIQAALAKHMAQPQAIPKQLNWADVPGQALQNAPASAAKFASDLVLPILHPIETGKGLFNVGYGLASKAYGALGGQQDPATKAQDEATVDAIGGALKSRYGSLDSIKNTLSTDPVGALGDASLLLSGGGTATSRLPGVLGRVGEIAATAGRAADPLAAAASVAKGTGKAANAILGTTSGVGGMPFPEITAAAFAKNSTPLEHAFDATKINDVVDMANAGMASLIKERGKAYRAGTQELRTAQTPVDFAPIDRVLGDVGETLHHNGIIKDPYAAAKHTEMLNKLADFKALPPVQRTPEALDALKQSVGAIRDSIPFEQRNARRVAGEVYKAIGDEIRRQVPSYAAAMKGYAEASDTINEVGKTLSVGGKATKDQTLRKLQSVMRNNVNTNYGARVQLAQELAKTQPNLMPAIAGQAVNSWLPRGFGNIGPGMGLAHFLTSLNPLALAMLPLSSPKLIGLSAYGLGRGARVAKDVSDAVGGEQMAKLLGLAYRGSNAVRPITSTGLLGD